MSEGEIIEIVSATYDRYWVIYQWWVSISIGVLILAHLTAARLNSPLLLATMLLYSIYTLWVAVLLEHNVEIYVGYINDLAKLDKSISEGSQFISGMKGLNLGVHGVTLGKIAAVLMYFSTNAYLVYSFLHKDKSKG